MNSKLKATVFALLTLGLNHLHADIEIEAKLIEASSDISVTSDLTALSEMKGVDLLSAPRVTVKPGTKAKIDITREFAIEGQEPIPVGIKLEIIADETQDGLSYIARYKLTEFKGFRDAEGKRLPIFQTITIPFNGPARDSIPILIDASGENESSQKRYIHLTIKKV
jgi:hypothetical protein